MTQLDANPDSAPEKGETAFCKYASPGGDQCIKETSVILIRDNNNPHTKKLGDLSAKQLSCIAVLTPDGKIDDTVTWAEWTERDVNNCLAQNATPVSQQVAAS